MCGDIAVLGAVTLILNNSQGSDLLQRAREKSKLPEWEVWAHMKDNVPILNIHEGVLGNVVNMSNDVSCLHNHR